MATEVIVPEVGEVGMDVTFVRWLKAEGDEVRIGDELFEVDTAKAVLAVEAYVDGRLASLRVGDGDLVTPHQVVALILAPGEEAPLVRAPGEGDSQVAAGPAASPVATAPVPTGSTPETASVVEPSAAGRAGASPRARRLARDRGIDLATLTGSGPGGLITEQDVERAGVGAPRAPASREIAVASSRAIEAIDVTDLLLGETLPDGFALCAIQHTTAAIIICEGDPDMLTDIETAAAGLFAPFEPFRHRRNDNPNAAAHLVSSAFGTQVVLPVVEGRIELGTWQRVVFLELDGPRERRIRVAWIGPGGA